MEQRHLSTLRAVIYVIRTDDLVRWQLVCLEWCGEHMYNVVGLLVADPDHRQWPQAEAMIVNGEADIIVTASEDHPDPTWAPRLEVARPVEHHPTPTKRRPRILASLAPLFGGISPLG